MTSQWEVASPLVLAGRDSFACLVDIHLAPLKDQHRVIDEEAVNGNKRVIPDSACMEGQPSGGGRTIDVRRIFVFVTFMVAAVNVSTIDSAF